MAVKDSATEELIKNTAKKLFFAEGRFQATTQEIAEAAQVNRTLVHYYFRSRDALFSQILQEAMQRMQERMGVFFRTDLSFRQKVEGFVDVYLREASLFPYLDSYVVSQMNENMSSRQDLFNDISHKEKTKAFFALIEEAVRKKEIHPMEPVQFFLNLFSLLAHPISLQPVYKKVFNISDKRYQKLMDDRREIILKLLFIK